MNAHFSRSLSLLRQEKRISQRTAAKELGISQALLSHYENGIREPGLAFVARACDFYNVSADFLLGRTLSRDGTTIVDAETLYDDSAARDNVMQGSVMATLSKKLLVNSISVIFDLLGKYGSKKAIRAGADYLSTVVYAMFRLLYSLNPDNSKDFFATPRAMFLGGLPTVELCCAQAEMMEAINEKQKEKPLPKISNETLARDYPNTYQSLLQVVHNVDMRMDQQANMRKQLMEKEK